MLRFLKNESFCNNFVNDRNILAIHVLFLHLFEDDLLSSVSFSWGASQKVSFLDGEIISKCFDTIQIEISARTNILMS